MKNDDERRTILDYLQINDSKLLEGKDNASLVELINLLIDKANNSDFENSILSFSYEYGIPFDRYEEFFTEVSETLSHLSEGEETSEDFLEVTAKKYK